MGLESVKKRLQTTSGEYSIYHIPSAAAHTEKLPYSLRVLLESALRNMDESLVHSEDIAKILDWKPKGAPAGEFPFKPGRVVLQDFTGVPAIVDLAALRSAVAKKNMDPSRINPLVRVDLVIDHSVQVDYFASDDAYEKNLEKEFERNQERYRFLKWGRGAFQNLNIIPPGMGIVHQINLEYLGELVLEKEGVLYPDSLVGTDSHTPMINGLGVIGWGVGGIEAEAAMLGQPYYMPVPDVIGFELTGKLGEGVTATDMVLTITKILRSYGVVGKFVEFFGEGLEHLSIQDRATISNMAPEYGATVGFFPVDDEVIRYLRFTGRSEKQIDLVESYYKEQGMFRTKDSPVPDFTDTVRLDLSTVESSLSGPKRPQDLILLSRMAKKWPQLLSQDHKNGGFAVLPDQMRRTEDIAHMDGRKLTHGDVVIAAITSCTNTSNPGVLIAAGLLAKKAVEAGLSTHPYVKTSLAPGSRVVTDYLEKSGLSKYLDTLGFHTVGYGCTTCIGNSGPLPENIRNSIHNGNLVTAAILSGNRNFEARINPDVKANFLASPPLVVAYAIAGNMGIDILNEPLGKGNEGKEVYLKDVWPTGEEIRSAIEAFLSPEMYRERYSSVYDANEIWNAIDVPEGTNYNWDPRSTYIREPDFFKDLSLQPDSIQEIHNARVLVRVGDSVTTDHISPAGAIPLDSPASRYLQSNGVEKKDFNSYGSRRGNHEVMTRGTFGNIRLRNLLVPETEGGVTMYFPDNQVQSIYDASMKYQESNTPLLVLAGAEYGSGSSRDWAAKGTSLLGIKAVIAVSYERIHRSNLVGMGVLPLQFEEGQSAETLGLTGKETYQVQGLSDDLKPGMGVTVVADNKTFSAIVRLDSDVEVNYYRNGGILQTVLRKMINET